MEASSPAEPLPNPIPAVLGTSESNDESRGREVVASKGHNGSTSDGAAGLPEANEVNALSKSQLKKQKRKQVWEDKKEDRKRQRKEKRHDRQERKRAERDAQIAEAEAEGRDPEEVRKSFQPPRRTSQLVPLTFIVDCDFERYMTEHELVSLSTQITRCYSTNKSAEYRAQLFFSSWEGALKTRFETVYDNNHLRWHDSHFTERDFVGAASAAHDIMGESKQDDLPGVLRHHPQAANQDANLPAGSPPAARDDTPADGPSVVYLTSDSPHTLDRLEPYTSYVVGGIVDRNREKGICYKRAAARGVRTAKLPIGEHMTMASRFVLTTNQVVEIMSKWLECGDWGAAFAAIIPQRKGGKLRDPTTGAAENDEGDESGQGVPVLEKLEPAQDQEEAVEAYNEAAT